MACVRPPEVTEAELIAAIDGEADSATLAHLASCPHCAARARSIGQFQDHLRHTLFRQCCPPPETLGDYHFGLLKPARRRAIAAHLATCPHCTRELAELEAYLAELRPELEPGLVERVRVLVARLISTGTGGVGLGLQPAYGGLRGNEEAGPALYEADGYQVSLMIDADLNHPGRQVILGLVTGESTTGMDVHLNVDGHLVRATAVDEAGNFVLDELEPGTYQLILRHPALEIKIEPVTI